MATLRKALLIVGKLTAECPVGGQCKYSFEDKDKKTVTGKCDHFAGTHEDERGLFVRCRNKIDC